MYKSNRQTGKPVYKKLTIVLNKNKRFKIISGISDILNGQESISDDISDNLTADDLVFYKYSPTRRCWNKFFYLQKLTGVYNMEFFFQYLMQVLVIQWKNSEYTVINIWSNPIKIIKIVLVKLFLIKLFSKQFKIVI